MQRAQPDRDQVLDAYAKLPPVFVQNTGQLDPQVQYYAQGAGYGLAFRSNGATLSSAKGQQRSAIELGFIDASRRTELAAGTKGSGVVSYFTGNEPSEWRTGLSTYGQRRHAGASPAAGR
jgi:hypothetical protein